MKTKTVIIFLGILTLLRCVWIAFQGIAPQEAYQWMCAARLAPALFDGPPGPAFLVKILGSFFAESLDFVRVCWPFLGLLAAWLTWLLARAVYDEVVAGWVVVALNALPVFNENAVTVSPAMPALILVLGGMVCAQAGWNGRGTAWIFASVFFAVATLFRYEAVLVPMSLCFTLLLPIHGRRPNLMACVSFLLLPMVALWAPLKWNAALEWVPLVGGTLRTFWQPNFSNWPAGLAAFLHDFSFGFAVAGIIAFLAMIRSAFKPGRAVFLLAVSALPAIWAAYNFVVGREFYSASWIACVPILIFLAGGRSKSRQMPTFGVAVVLVGLIFSGVTLRESGLMRSGWNALVAEIHESSRSMPGGGFLIAENEGLASVLSVFFKSAGKNAYPSVFVPESPAMTSQFGIWPSYADFIETDHPVDEYFTEQKGKNPFVGWNALFMGAELPQTIKAAFADVLPLRKVILPDGSRITIYLCKDYQTLPL